MPTRSIKKIPVFVWVPPELDVKPKIEIVTSSGTHDITDYIINGEYTDGVTDTIGNFTFTIENTHQEFSDKFSLYDEIRIYLDYATTATTLRFKGLLEKVSYQDGDIAVSGRSIASRVMGITVSKSYENQYTHDILSDILTIYAPYITQTNIDTTESTDTQITLNWYQKPLWECILELCNMASYDAYIDCNSDFNYFVSGSRENTTDAVVHDHNLIGVEDFTPDLTNIKNRIIVYGASVGDIPIMATAEDATSFASYDIKELIINDSNIITVAQAQSRADYELSLYKDPPIIGEITSDQIATILPGEKIRISDQESGIYPIFYNIQSFTQKFGEDEQTILTILKEQSSIPKILKKRIIVEKEITSNPNPNEMHYSVIFNFETDNGSHSNTVIDTASGILKTDGSSTGTWTSPVISVPRDITEMESRISGSSLSGTLVFLSANGGQSYSTGLPATIESGDQIRIRIELKSADTQIDACGALYNMES